LPEASDHQRMGERPGLAGMIDDAPQADARFLQRFAANGCLYGFSGLDEARQRRVHARFEMWAASKQASVARDCEHDRNRVSAGEMFRRALGTDALVAAGAHFGSRPATAAKSVIFVPG